MTMKQLVLGFINICMNYKLNCLHQKTLSSTDYLNTPEKICKYINKFFPIVKKYHSVLRFTAVENMLQTITNRKVLVPNLQNQPIILNSVELPHIAATCCCSILGIKMPLFVILKKLTKLPSELKEFADNEQAFTLSVDCFINWLSQYRKSFDESIRNFI